MVFVKMLSYALNNPVKEFMYIPTSKDVKFKVKAVIDGFGGKAAKGIGSVINAACSSNPAMLVAYGSIASLGIIGVWIVVAMFVGQSYDQLIEEKKILD
jgi:AAA family ATP:ADP antiporter